MNTTFKVIAAVLLSIIIITGCKPRVTTPREVINRIAFDTLAVHESYYLLGDSTNPGCLLESIFIFPSDYADKKIFDKITRQFINDYFGESMESMTPQDAMDSYVKKYITDYKELEEDFIAETQSTGEKPSVESWYAYYEFASTEIVYNEHNLLSYIVSVDYYTGGAHGGHSYTNHVLSLKNGEALIEVDIFIGGFQDELAQIIVDRIASNYQVTEPEELENEGFFNISEIYPNNNFYVNGEGITYTFNEYEIAAYFVGSVDIFIPFDEISHLIRENSPVEPLVVLKK